LFLIGNVKAASLEISVTGNENVSMNEKETMSIERKDVILQ
jgi:hypothetical protein